MCKLYSMACNDNYSVKLQCIHNITEYNKNVVKCLWITYYITFTKLHHASRIMKVHIS